ncbi:hypothetical protein M0Q97_10720 [Candidatus Dojkabacteria bacterium]|jgi:hypothetical protein|nr:hypothetical protein [Candidatus Dojkabacteria bacterium]
MNNKQNSLGVLAAFALASQAQQQNIEIDNTDVVKEKQQVNPHKNKKCKSCLFFGNECKTRPILGRDIKVKPLDSACTVYHKRK